MATIIANPIYDSVIKYLLADLRAAKILIGDLLQKKVVSLKVSNNEHVVKKEEEDFSVLRVDFSAEVKNSSGVVENVNIEIQKAWLPTEIRRFRRYIARQYESANNYFVVQNRPLKEKNLHMVNIYLLGHEVEGLPETVTYVYPKVYNQDKEMLNVNSEDVEFISGLAHDMIIVQIPKIRKESVRTRLDQLLTLFYQSEEEKTPHQLMVDEDSYSKEHQYIVRRLAQACSEEEMAETMAIEDEINDMFVDSMQCIADMKEQLASKDELLASKDEQLASKNEQLARSVLALVEMNLPVSQIAEMLSMTKDEVERIIRFSRN